VSVVRDRRRRREQAVGDLVSGALKDLGVPPMRVSAPLAAAFERALEPAWRGQVRLERLQGGVLEVGVSSASLRQELAQYHATRLLSVLRQAVPDVTCVQLRFVAVAPGAPRKDAIDDESPDVPASNLHAPSGHAQDRGDAGETR
jgi:hypothetical protein